MTTKWKIILGFSVLVLLSGVISYFGYSGMQQSSANLEEYRRLAIVSGGVSDIEARFNAAGFNLFRYIFNPDTAYLKVVKDDLDAIVKYSDQLDPYLKIQSSKDILAKIKAESAKFNVFTNEVQRAMVDTDQQYRGVVLKAAIEKITLLRYMSEYAVGTRNSDALGVLNRVSADLINLMSGLSRFAYSRRAEDSATVRKYMVAIEESLGKLSLELTSAAGVEDMKKIRNAYKALSGAYEVMEKNSVALNEKLTAAGQIMAECTRTLKDLNVVVSQNMTNYGQKSLSENAATQRYVLITSVVVLISGIVIALLTVLSLIRVLTSMSTFAKAVAEGDFAHNVKIKEKGEIGLMLESVREIPAVIERIINNANVLADRIRTGHLRDRFDTGTLPGNFDRLGVAVNTVGAAFLQLIDAMPSPIMACTKDKVIIFTNHAYDNTIGKDTTGKNCMDVLKTPSCKNDSCVGTNCMQHQTGVTAEISTTAKGKDIEVSVSAIPLVNSAGESAGFVEIMIDITEIKQKQETMTKVASEASSIADRVAAAAEQLAAQVEQISRGAEVQRSRVEKTATAMTEMNETVLEVARNASNASEQSENTRSRADAGSSLVHQVVSAINDVNDVGMRLQTNMEGLGHQAESIGGVMTVITDIADQTNLLALNAAIEAARAGEAGRGFAVVADEVRKLAEKTMAATQEVGGNITAVQNSAKANQEEVENAVRSVGEATTLAGQSGQALEEILTFASENFAIVSSIATAAEEQSATSEEINRAIDEINRITGETTEGMVQSSGAVQELSSMAQELKSVLQSLG